MRCAPCQRPPRPASHSRRTLTPWFAPCACGGGGGDAQPIVSPASSISHLVFVVDIMGVSTALQQGTAQVLRSNTLRWAQVSDMSSLWYPPTSRLWYERNTTAFFAAPQRNLRPQHPVPKQPLSKKKPCLNNPCRRALCFVRRLDFGTVYRHRTTGMAPGLYLGVLYVQNDFHGIDVLVPKGAP